MTNEERLQFVREVINGGSIFTHEGVMEMCTKIVDRWEDELADVRGDWKES